MNIKSYTNESLQVDDDEKESKLATTHSEHKEVGARAAHVVVVVVDEAKAELLHNQQQQQQQHHNKDKAYVATAATTTTAATANHLNIEAIEKAASMVAINNNDGDNDKDKDNNCNNNNNISSSSNSGCNKIKKPLRQRRISLSENHNHNKYSHDSSHSNIDVQTFTNTKELNQVNLNSSSTTTATSQSLLSTSLEAASATTTTTAAITTTKSSLATATVAEISQQQKQLIMSPTAGSSSTTPATATTTASSAVHLRKSHSTPALKFAGNSSSHSSSNHIVVEYDQCTINNNNNNKNDGCKFKTQVESAMEASNIAIKDVAVAAHLKRQQQHHQQPLQHEQLQRLNGNNDSNKCNTTIDATKPATPESLRFGCTHYKRRAMFVTPCCNKFYKCRFCHDENESHHFDRKTLTELICSECNTRQKVQEQCENCGVRFGKYTCLICNLFDDADKQQYHCHGCGICRIGGAHNFFHCEVCNMCLPIQLKIDGHRCVENISRSHCPVCLGDIHTSRIPCHIPDCGHLLHKMCFDQLLASGHYTCPTCQTSLIDMTALWEYLDAQALRMPVPLKYENQRVHIFCNDCHKTSKTKFHFIGLKCVHCGAYNTTQDVKRRLSLVTDEPTTA